MTTENQNEKEMLLVSSKTKEALKSTGLNVSGEALEKLNENLNEDVACVIIQNPNFFGLIEDGQTIGEMDMMIAAHSLSVGAILVSNNLRHFERIKLPLTLKNWA